jgi:hypothetical protein
MLEIAMTKIRNGLSQPKQTKAAPVKTYCRSPYHERTHVIRVPESLLPRVHKLLDECRQDVADAAWLGR